MPPQLPASYRYGETFDFIGGDEGDDIPPFTGKTKTGSHRSRTRAPSQIADGGELEAMMLSYSYDYSYEHADTALVEVALVESSLVLENVSMDKLGNTETVLFGETVSAMLSHFNLYSTECYTVISTISGPRVKMTFTVEIVVHHDNADPATDDWRGILSEQVQATLTKALTAGEFSATFAAAAEESSSTYFADFGTRDLYNIIDIDSSAVSIAANTRVIRDFGNQLLVPTSPPSPSSTLEVVSTAMRHDASLDVQTSGYSTVSGPSLYPWDYIVEPHKTTTIRFRDACDGDGHLLDNTRTPVWSVTFQGTDTRRVNRGAGGNASPARAQHRMLGDLAPETAPQVLISRSERGCDVDLNFTHVSQIYDLAIELPNSRRLAVDTRTDVDTYVATLMCKYVRREMRAVTSDDKNRYLEAMRIVSTTPLDEGRRRFGSKFANLEYFAVKHIHTEECSPFHGGLSFITSHAAFTLELEQALQSVDARVTQPYWDYTLDAALLGTDWDSAAVFSNDWFGSAHPGGPDNTVASTFFQEVPVPTNFSRPVRNSYGRVTSTINNDPSHFVTRAHTFCGLPITMPLPGCPEMIGCLKAENLPDLHKCMEDELHGDLHAILGGSWDCAYEIAEVVSLSANHSDLMLTQDLANTYVSEYQKLLGEIGCKAKPIWNKMWNKKFMKCPLYCSEDTAFSNCSCSCPSLDHVEISVN